MSDHCVYILRHMRLLDSELFVLVEDILCFAKYLAYWNVMC